MPWRNMSNYTHCLYHANCLDGFAAAYCCWLTVKDKPSVCQFIPVQYGDPLPAIPDGSKVAIVDFSFPRDVLDALAERCDLTVLDHHKTAEEALRGAPYAIFDMTKSGCRLAWEHFYPWRHLQATFPTPKGWIPKPEQSYVGSLIPFALVLIEDRDLWKFENKETKAFCAGITEAERDFDTWHHIIKGGDGPDGLHLETYRIGESIVKYTDAQAKRQAKNAVVTAWDGHTVACANVTNLISETGHVILDLFPEVSFSMTYFDKPGKRIFNLRSRAGVDVSEIAKQFGGGGHRNAASFSVPCNPYTWPLETTGRFDHV